MDRNPLRAARLIGSIAFKADRGRAALLFGLTAARSFLTTFSAFWLKLITDSVLTHQARGVAIASVGLGATALINGVMAWYGFNLQTVLLEKSALAIDKQMVEVTGSLPGIEHHERPDYQNEISLLRVQRDQLSRTVASLVQGLSVVVQAATTVYLLTALHPLMLLLPLFGIPSLLAGGKAVSMSQRAQEETVESERLTTHLFKLATTPGPGKELRVFGIGNELIERHGRIWKKVDRIRLGANYRAAFITASGWLVFAIGYVAAILFISIRAANGLATPGEVILALTLAAQVNGQVEGAVQSVGFVMQSLRIAGRLVWLIEYGEKAKVSSSATKAVPASLTSGIDLQDVSFIYPGTEWEVLTNVNLHFPAGCTVAIVGENGAGKSTLVKLLGRLYEPTSGAIKVDGIDIRAFPIEEWRRRMSAGFQDFTRFEMIAQEVVGVGDLPFIQDEGAVSSALLRAKASDVIERLPHGYATQLGRSFEEGVDLSGGQWQKLALGRAMMRQAPLMLLLDEPTASLDAETEHALFERYASESKRVAATNGAITILVSHRFSTVRMADLIVVVNDGQVEAVGSHDELMKAGGLYAELYELQARSYK